MVSLGPSRRCFGDALDQVQRCQHEHLFRFGLNSEKVTLLELAERVGEQLLLGVVARGVCGGCRFPFKLSLSIFHVVTNPVT